jgi:XTP/dITP diphosphohydrolase
MTVNNKTLVFATANRNKLIEAAGVLGERFSIVLPADLGYTNDVPETHFTIRENAIEKAQFIWDMFGRSCFADDTGLEVDALDGAPGVFSARYAGEPKNPVMNVRKLLREMEGIPFAERTARFRCVIALIEEGELTVFEGICEGHIALQPQGELGFGYDPVFIPEGMEKTMAMLTLDEKNAISHRGKALDMLAAHLGLATE